MARVGQLIYNLEDYDGSGTMIASNKTGTKIEKSSDTTYETNRLDIYSNLFSFLQQSENSTTTSDTPFVNESLKKVGIQAPPGTAFFINTASQLNTTEYRVIMGRSGIYELEEDAVRIRGLRFEKQYKWVLDEKATSEKLNEGYEKLKSAYENFQTGLEGISYLKETDTKEYWKQYDILFQTYLKEYDEAFAIYTQGVNGVYKNSEIPIELKNIIIDYVAETDDGGAK